NWYLARAHLSATADAILNTAALLARDWHYSLDALYLRMGDVRVEAASRRLSAPHSPKTHSSATHSPNPHSPETPSPEKRQDAASTTGNIWARARAYRLHADAGLTGRAFTQYAYGLTAGGDRAFRLDEHAGTALLGGFIDQGRIDRDFAGAGATGHTSNLSAGLYAAWLHDAGWHADLVLKADRYKHRFDTLTAAGHPVRGAYTSAAQGLSLELGRRFEQNRHLEQGNHLEQNRYLGQNHRLASSPAGAGWWVEPAAQAAIAWLRGADYRTTPGNQTLDVKLDTARAAQYRALVRFGRTLANSRWTPYGKFGVARTDTAGGTIHAGGKPFVPDCDGWREEFGFGASWRIDAESQLYLDYEYSKAARHERPWSLHLGHRRLW
ncbi:MAG: autotransporter outer membrane beta-barrel domain-containing protein, partial [Opitutaceae bacterium]|nr:autotransporter outer membrane beta-barrel domain-containing protein [Opitutaceae bacterium]